MVRIGQVWDGAVEAVRGRLGVIAPIAAAAILLPSVIQTAMQSYYPPVPGDAGRAGLGFLVTLALMAVTFWGALAITAITSHPDVTRADAGRQASSRLLPLLGASIVLGLAGSLLLLPAIAILAASGVDMSTLGQQGAGPEMRGGPALFVGLYLLVVMGLLIWLLARLLPLVPTVLHERIGLRAIGRAYSLTRGIGWKLVGVILLYFIVLAVASGAAQFVGGAVFGLALGNENAATAAFLGGVMGAVAATILSVLGYAFTARLYVMLTGRDLSRIFEDEPSPA